MSKYLLIKSKYNLDGERDIESFCVIKKDKWHSIVEDIQEYFDNDDVITLDVPVEGIDELSFFEARDILGEDNLEVLPIKKSGYHYIQALFGKEYGECSLLAIHKALKQAEAFNDICGCNEEDIDAE